MAFVKPEKIKKIAAFIVDLHSNKDRIIPQTPEGLQFKNSLDDLVDALHNGTPNEDQSMNARAVYNTLCAFNLSSAKQKQEMSPEQLSEYNDNVFFHSMKFITEFKPDSFVGDYQDASFLAGMVEEYTKHIDGLTFENISPKLKGTVAHIHASVMEFADSSKSLAIMLHKEFANLPNELEISDVATSLDKLMMRSNETDLFGKQKNVVTNVMSALDSGGSYENGFLRNYKGQDVFINIVNDVLNKASKVQIPVEDKPLHNAKKSVLQFAGQPNYYTPDSVPTTNDVLMLSKAMMKTNSVISKSVFEDYNEGKIEDPKVILDVMNNISSMKKELDHAFLSTSPNYRLGIKWEPQPAVDLDKSQDLKIG